MADAPSPRGRPLWKRYGSAGTAQRLLTAPLAAPEHRAERERPSLIRRPSERLRLAPMRPVLVVIVAELLVIAGCGEDDGGGGGAGSAPSDERAPVVEATRAYQDAVL